MIFCTRATRGLRRPSLDARSGRSTAPIPDEITSELGRIIYMYIGRSIRAVEGNLGLSLQSNINREGNGAAKPARR